MAAKRKHRNTNEYLRYLKGELSREDRHSFERDLEADPFEMEAMEGMEQIGTDALEDDLLSLHAGLQARLRRRKRRTWYYAAATIASLLIVGTVFINIYEINPKTSSESIPADETFLHEDAGMQRETPELEITAAKEEKSETIVPEEATPERKEVVDADDAEADITDADIVDADIVEFVEAEAETEVEFMEDAAMVLDDEAVDAAMAVEADEVEAEVAQAREGGALEAEAKEAEKAVDPVAEAPAPVRDEVIVVEAQPKRSQKKGRAREAEAPVSYDLEYAAEQISGIVLSLEDMQPLPGASIAVKGSDSGLVADMNGRFSLVAGQEESTRIIASYVGMETEEYQLAVGKDNQVLMRSDQLALSEVVVIGYDADKSRYATGAVQTVNFKQEDLTYSGAEPEGGLEAFKMYIEEQIRFPAGDTLSKKELVVLKFNVDRDGSISNIQSLRSPGTIYTEEAIRLLTEGPSWNPARNESGATDDVVRMRIVFKR